MTATTDIIPAKASDVAATRDVARVQGAVAALSALAGLVPAVTLPGECLLLPPGVQPPAGSRRLAEERSDVGSLVAWRVPTSPESARPAPGPGEADADARWRTGVAWVRTGLSERLLEHAVEHLRGRKVAGVATVKLPTVRLVVGEAALVHLEAQALLTVPERDSALVPAVGLARVTQLLDHTLREVHDLFGAAGIVDGAPARLARVIDLLGHASGSLPECAHDEGEA